MRPSRRIALAGLLAAAAAGLSPQDTPVRALALPGGMARQSGPQDPALIADLDRIFDSPVLARGLVGVRIESLRTGETLYERNGARLVVPASNMKLLTLSVAAERLGWTHRFETRLEAAGSIANGTLTGDLVVVGGGDPSVVAQDFTHAPLFLEWADALLAAGVRRVTGRVIGDDNAFDDESLGAGWAWDYLTAAYAAPSGALSYNENVVAVRITPGRTAGEAAAVELAPPGATFEIAANVLTGPAGGNAAVTVSRMPGSSRLEVGGRVPAGGSVVTRVTTIDNPTRYFVEGLRQALLSRGIVVRGGAWDIDDIEDQPAAGRQVLARRASLPLSALGAHFLKVSQNFYGEMFLKAIGRASGRAGSASAGRQVVRETLGAWGIDADSFVMNDGSGLSRYDYVTADAIVTILKHVWQDERLRGPFVAALPVGAHDGTLESRMKDSVLARRVQAKTGTISNMRALSGYLETNSGEKIVFSIIANHFTAPTSQIDAVAERALARVAER